MIIPIYGLKYYHFAQPLIGEAIRLVKEKTNLYDPLAIAAYNKANQKIGYISARSCYNKKVYNRMLEETVHGIVWSVGINQILVEIDFSRI